MSIEKYRHLFTKEYMMGPNTVRLLDEMLEKYPIDRYLRVMDLGCGTGLSSIFLAKEKELNVFAVDLWCTATDNHRRFTEWGVENVVVPIHANALDLPFADEYFDAVISVDSYHYFACDSDYFGQKLLPLLKRGGAALIVVPGLKEEFGETVPPEIYEWAGEEYRLFHSCDWWKNTIGSHPDIASAEFLELECADAAWQEWFDSEHEYALNDKRFFEKGIGRYLNIVGMVIRKAQNSSAAT